MTSPLVVTITSSAGCPAAISASRTVPAWVVASRLPRVPMRSVRTAVVFQRPGLPLLERLRRPLFRVFPDGTRIAYKERVDGAGGPWRLTVLDLATRRETPVAERRSVDDQAEWLDGERLLYGLDGQVWAARADGTGAPVPFRRAADSPAVVRP